MWMSIFIRLIYSVMLKLSQRRKTYQASYDQYMKLQKELKIFKKQANKRLQMLDLYRFQIEEISAAKLKIGEDETLAEEKRKLANAEKLYQSSSEAYDFLYATNRGLRCGWQGGIHDCRISSSWIQRILSPLLEQAQSAFYQMEDAAYQITGLSRWHRVQSFAFGLY